jgi:endonuclease III related protein
MIFVHATVMRNRLLTIFNTLLTVFGERHWWPGDTPLEIIVGALLTQNTSWKNVEKAINNMKAEGILSINALYKISHEKLAKIITPAGYYNIKSSRLKNIIKVLYEEYDASINNLNSYDTERLRDVLLAINGIGPETADSILLYVFNKPVFVVDAYTVRFVTNHYLYNDDTAYHNVQNFFMRNLPSDSYLFNEFHALIVCLCQRYCKKSPACNGCPLENDRGGYLTND